MDSDLLTPGEGGNRFSTTRWSVILSSVAGPEGEDEARKALATLCQTYWRPIFAYICFRGNQPDDAQDLTQDFFLSILQSDLLRRADPERGRFRSLLLKSLQNFMRDAHSKRMAKKRGGAVRFVSWDDWMAEAPSHLTLPAQALEHWSAERLFDVRWAATVVERALGRLREECEARGRRRVFDALSHLLSAERADIHYDDLGTQLGVDAATAKRLVHHLRQRYRELLRDEVAQTVERPEDVEEEIRYLCSALAVSGS